MQNFEYYTPTKVVFGRDTEVRAGELAKAAGAKKVLLHYGSASAKKTGLLGRVSASLVQAGLQVVELGGVVPNPRVALVREGVALCKAEEVDFVLAVGGGSVIDSAKAIALGACTQQDVWDFYTGKAEPQASLLVGSVLTIAAAGSEMSRSSVITNEETGEKRGLRLDLSRPCFAIMNPELTITLPAHQTAAGCADVLLHTVERYFTPEKPTMDVTDGLAESLMRSIMANARILLRKPGNYKARAEIMWAGSLSHNDLMGCGGGPGDWASHQLGHELSAMFDLAHGESITAVWSSWARYVYKTDVERFARFAEQVMELPYEGDDEAMALAGIEEMEGFFWAIEMPTSLAEAGLELTDEQLADLALRCTYYGKRTVGALQVLEKEELEAIYKMAR